MSDDEWNDSAPVVAPQAAVASSFGSGKGRGFSSNNDSFESYDSGLGGRGGGRGGYNNRSYDNEDGGGYKPRGGGRGGRGGFNRFNRDDDSNNDEDGGYKPRGGGRGGRGGFNRDNGGGYGNDNENDGDDGGYKPRGGGRGGRGGFNRYNDNADSYGGDNNDGDDGGYKPRGGGRGGRGGFNRYNDNGNDDNGNDGGYKPRGGRGGRGGGGGRGGYNRNDDDDDNDGGNRYGDRDDGEGGYRPRGGGRGGRGGGGGGGRGGDRNDDGFNNDDGEQNEDPNKPQKMTYIPPELSNDRNEIFNNIETGINFQKYDDIKVNVSGTNPPPPVESFEDAPISKLVRENIRSSNYSKPTPVQKYAIPIIAAGRDLMACAQTGSGKTAAYLLPIMSKLIEDQIPHETSKCCPNVLILAPTRELAIQINKECHKFAQGSTLKYKLIYGGSHVMTQANQVASGCHILTATTGRLKDFVERGRVSFECVQYIVLDEADRMLDMGFSGDVEMIFDHETMVPKEKRQVLMFSATFQKDIQELAQKYLRDYLFLAVGIVGGACSDVIQEFIEVKKHEKKKKLLDMLNSDTVDENHKVLIFVDTRRNTDYLGSWLCENHLLATTIHGDRYQQQREEALRVFNRGEVCILVASDVMARGIDVAKITHVINFDLPEKIDDYTHRIGRTGRLGHTGKATSFYDPDKDHRIRASLVKIVKGAGQEVPDWLDDNSGDTFNPGRSEFGGKDFRKFGNSENEGQFNSPSIPVENDEEW